MISLGPPISAPSFSARNTRTCTPEGNITFLNYSKIIGACFLQTFTSVSTHCDASHTRLRFHLHLVCKASCHSSSNFAPTDIWLTSLSAVVSFSVLFVFAGYELSDFFTTFLIEFQRDKEINVNTNPFPLFG